MISCSFTGHRAIPAKHTKKLDELLDRAIEYAYSEGCRVFHTGGALGFDTVVAKKLLTYRMRHTDVRLIVVVPCKDQSVRWSESDRDMYDYILANADEVVFCSDEYSKDCMKKRNAYLAEVCDVLFAYCGRNSSGSAQTLRMASALGKTVYNLYPSVEK